MNPVSLMAFGVMLASLAVGWRRRTLVDLLLAVLLMIIHLGTTFYYYSYSQVNIADAWGYYYQPYIYAGEKFAPGTMTVVKLVEFLKIEFGASYLDCFLFFQSFGFAGLVILMKTFAEIEENLSVPHEPRRLYLLFLPSVSFWTSAIGKDAPLFFAIALCLWSMLKFRKRFLQFAISIAVMIMFRAHIALMAATALAITALFEGGISGGRKLALLGVALVGLALSVTGVESSYQLDVTNAAALASFFDEKSVITSNLAGATSVGNATWIFRLLSLFYRPFFFDANGFMGVIASIENLLFLLGTGYLVLRWRNLFEAIRKVFFLRFAILFAATILVTLSFVYYNVGLGLRQRVMSFPMLFSVIMAIWCVRSRGKLDPIMRARPDRVAFAMTSRPKTLDPASGLGRTRNA